MNDAPPAADNPAKTRDPRRGTLLLYLFGMITALVIHPAIKALESGTAGLGATAFLVPVGLTIPLFVAVGYAFALPLLCFSNTIVRYALAIFIPMPLWILFLLGMQITYDGSDREMWSQGTACLLISLMGGCIPISLVMGIGQWRLGIGGADRIPIGVSDFLAVITFGAVVFAYFRQMELFGDPELSLGLVMLILGFYALVGAVVLTSLLLAMRMVLGADDRPFGPMNLIGVAFTMLLMTAAWSILLLANDGVFAQSPGPILQLTMLSAVSWLIAAASALAIGWWLRCYGFRLTSASIERRSVASES